MWTGLSDEWNKVIIYFYNKKNHQHVCLSKIVLALISINIMRLDKVCNFFSKGCYARNKAIKIYLFFLFLGHILKIFQRSRSRYQTYLYLSPVKIILFSLIGLGLHGYPITEYFSTFMKAWQSHEILVYSGEVSKFNWQIRRYFQIKKKKILLHFLQVTV